MTNNNDDQIFETLLEYLHNARGFDFTGYKRSSLKRRVYKQMQSRQVYTFSDYLDYLQVHPEEFYSLFNTILINVTAFFRDLKAWDYLQNEILPRIIENKSPLDPIRVWSVGCASGEEAYTLAIILAETLGIENCRQRVKIYATDVDEEALRDARHASYYPRSLENISTDLKEKYFEAVGDRFFFRPDLRRIVIFGRHDLIQDAPISRLDLLVCRNTLMYFNSETQARILNRFHFALNNNGYLFLGKAEMLLTHSNLFIPIHLQHRIFNKVNKFERAKIMELSQPNKEEINNNINRNIRLQELSFEHSPIAQIIVNKSGILGSANATARNMFNLIINDLGRPFQDLEISYRPTELRSQIEKVYQYLVPIQVKNIVRYLPDNSTQYLDISINPLPENSNKIIGVTITFTDVTIYHELQTELQRANQDLETFNEEMQSSNEELETTNEELQSSNEELETTNEELQSTNEELETMNDELQERTLKLNQTNAFLNSILSSLQVGVIVIDRQFKILCWNDKSENLWGLRNEEVKEQSLLTLDIGLPIEPLQDPIRNCLIEQNDHQEITLSAINRRGQKIKCRISFNPLLDIDRERLGVILLTAEI